MSCLAEMSYDRLRALCVDELGLPEYRAAQIMAHIVRFDDYEEMSDIPKSLRAALSGRFAARGINAEKKLLSRDGTVKYLFSLADGNIIEGAFMRQSYGNTLCASTQVGCRMGCAFCASGIGGLVRNLTAGEILSEVLFANRDGGGTPSRRAVTNIVLMGSGEPLDNYDEVTRFLRLVTAEKGINISERNISLSTCGLAENIRRLADDGFAVTLSVSLHASSDESRREIMPVARRYTIAEIVDAARYYFEKSGRRVIFEYTMIKDVNTSYFDAKRLARLLRGFPCHVNLIPLNPVKEKNLRGLSPAEEKRFLSRLTDMGVSATVRRSKGGDVGGACGQLRRGHLGGGK